MSTSHGSTEEGAGAGAASPAASPTDGNSDGPPELLEPLHLSENCRSCLAQLAFYEAGMVTNEAAAKSIAKRVCHNDLTLSNSLIHQVRPYLALLKLCLSSPDGVYFRILCRAWRSC